MPLKNPLQKESNYHLTVFILLATTMLSLSFSSRAINSLSLLGLVLITLINPQRLFFIKRVFSNPYFLACLTLFLIKAAGLLYTDHFSDTERKVTSKLILLAVPFFFCANNFLSSLIIKKLIICFTLSLFLVSVYCLINALFIYNKSHDPSVFFYHQLVKIFKHHAVIFSFYLFFCIVYWMEQGMTILNNRVVKLLLFGLLMFFFAFIVLLSSKLVILISIGYLSFFVIKKVLAAKIKLAIVLVATLMTLTTIAVVITDNPIKKRFAEITNEDFTQFRQEKFSPATYFNGLQLRLLMWRFTYEILKEKRAWGLGVSAGDAQYELNRKYVEANVYQGNGIDDKLGYRAFDCHNAFLQTTLESGLVGLFFFLSIIILFLSQAIRSHSDVALIFFIAVLAFCFTESMLVSQYGIILFAFFPLLSLNANKR